MIVNQAAIDLIKEFEGFEEKAYRDPVGILTIGYGTTKAAGVGIDPQLGMTITQDDAERYLQLAVQKFAAKIEDMIDVPVTDNQFGALVSLAYNIGPSALAKSTVMKRLNAGDYQGAADAFAMWNKAGGKVLAGLTRRRAAERALFLKPDDEPRESLLAMIIDALLGLWKK
jgi:lysozyme